MRSFLLSSVVLLFLSNNVFAFQVDQKVLKAFEAGFDTKEDFGSVYEFVLPSAEESEWREVPWIPSLWEGIEAAKKADKPMFIWAMNGDPLGCV